MVNGRTAKLALHAFLLACALSWTFVATAADYYISTRGNDARGCTNQTADACATFTRCIKVMAPGDTCYALAGTYTTSGIKGWNMYGAGGTSVARKTFRGMPNQTVIIKPASYLNSAQESTINIGDSAMDFVTFSDLTIYGRFKAAEQADDCADNVTLERIVFKCPGAVGVGNTVSLMTASSGADIDRDGTVDTWTPRDGWIIRDNVFTIDETCPDYAPYMPDGPDFIHLYSVSGAIVENNDFRIADATKSSLSPRVRFGLWFKGRAQHVRARLNYCEGDLGGCVIINTGKCPGGFLETCESILRPYSEGDNRAYQNVSFRSGTIGWDSSNYADGDAVYNNTVYRPRYDGINAAPRPGEGRSRAENSVFNNIVVADARDPVGNYYGYLRWVSNTDSDGICTQSFIDHNLYFPVSAGKHANFSANGHVSSSLSDWQAYLTANCANPEVRETHSRAVDPLFVDALSGDFRLQADSPARTGGRGGAWPSAIGAYVTGNEIVGCTFSELCHAKGYRLPPESEAPAKVLGVVRSDAR